MRRTFPKSYVAVAAAVLFIFCCATGTPAQRTNTQPTSKPKVEGRRESPVFALPNTSLTSATTAIAPSPGCVENLLSEYINWLNQSAPNGTHIVRVTAASNQKNRLVSYSEGTLSITVAPFPSGAGQPKPTGPYTLAGTLTQYFSDRKFGLQNGGIAIPVYPFSPQKTDQLGLSISTGGQIVLTLKSYNNKSISLTGVDCAAGVLYGLTNTSPTQSFYVISLSKDTEEKQPQIK